MALSSKDICRIIETCAANNVASIKISETGVEVEFDEPQKPIEYHISLPTDKPNQSKPQATPESPSGDLNHIEHFEQDPKDLADADEMAELQINNPLEFEERLARGELVDVQTEND